MAGGHGETVAAGPINFVVEHRTVVQEGVPAVIPVEACYLGWQESLVLLAKLVEAEIPDN